MKNFKMCSYCQNEYDDPTNRRYHAQPVACPECGPHVELWNNKGKVTETHHNAILKLVELIKAGEITALKGIGGFHLVCDAQNDDAIIKMRERKNRIDKPFALMFPSLESVKDVCYVDNIEENEVIIRCGCVDANTTPDKALDVGSAASRAARAWRAA